MSYFSRPFSKKNTLMKSTLRNDVAMFEHRYTATEINFFMVVLHCVQTGSIRTREDGSKAFNIEKGRVRDIFGYDLDMKDLIDGLNQKKITGTLKWPIVSDEGEILLKKGATYRFTPFPADGEDDENYFFEIHREFYPAIKNLSGNFTSIELESFLNLSSLGLKNFYKYLLANKAEKKEVDIHGDKFTVNVEIGIEELKRMLESNAKDNTVFLRNLKTQVLNAIEERTNIYDISITTDGKGRRKATKVYMIYKVKASGTVITPEQIEELNQQLEKLCKKNMEFAKGSKDVDFAIIWKALFKKYNEIAEAYDSDAAKLITLAMKKVQSFKFEDIVKNPRMTIEKQIEYILENEPELLKVEPATSAITVSASENKVDALETVVSNADASDVATGTTEKIKVTQAEYDVILENEISRMGTSDPLMVKNFKKLTETRMKDKYEIIEDAPATVNAGAESEFASIYPKKSLFLDELTITPAELIAEFKRREAEKKREEMMNRIFETAAELAEKEGITLEEALIKITEEEPSKPEPVGTPIEELDFTVRTFNSLKKAGLDTVEQLRSMSAEEIKKIKNLGKKSFEEIEETLGKLAEKMLEEEKKSI